MKPTWVKKVAQETISLLLRLAEKDSKKAKRYIELARKHSKKYKAPLGKKKRTTCKKCSAFLVPGKNLRVRKAPNPKPALIYTCLECGNKQRYGTSEKLKKRRSQNNS